MGVSVRQRERDFSVCRAAIALRATSSFRPAGYFDIFPLHHLTCGCVLHSKHSTILQDNRIRTYYTDCTVLYCAVASADLQITSYFLVTGANKTRRDETSQHSGIPPVRALDQRLDQRSCRCIPVLAALHVVLLCRTPPPTVFLILLPASVRHLSSSPTSDRRWPRTNKTGSKDATRECNSNPPSLLTLLYCPVQLADTR